MASPTTSVDAERLVRVFSVSRKRAIAGAPTASVEMTNEAVGFYEVLLPLFADGFETG